MDRTCGNCGFRAKLAPGWQKVTWHYLPRAGFPAEIMVVSVCEVCGFPESYQPFVAGFKEEQVPSIPKWMEIDLKRHSSMLRYRLKDGDELTINYAGVRQQISPSKEMERVIPNATKQYIMFPTNEGHINSYHWIDEHGDPYLMLEFSKTYLKGYDAIMPRDQRPKNIYDIAPAVLLLVNSAELAIKAYLYRSGKFSNESQGHNLTSLYQQMEDEHKREIQNRFTETETCKELRNLGAEVPTAESLLYRYSAHGIWDSAYEAARYFAEPTVMSRRLRSKIIATSKSLVYPIFFPDFIKTVIDVYEIFSGHTRLTHISSGAQDLNSANNIKRAEHGGWYLVPSTFELVAVKIDRSYIYDADNNVTSKFKIFRSKRLPVYEFWKHHNKLVLFFNKSEEFSKNECKQVDGVTCEISESEKCHLSSTNLYKLADAMEKQLSGAKGSP